MRLDPEELDALAHKVADILSQRLPISNDGKVLWSIRDIESYCGYQKNSNAVRKWILEPTFPNPIARTGHRRWFKEEVVEWIKTQRDTAYPLVYGC